MIFLILLLKSIRINRIK